MHFLLFALVFASTSVFACDCKPFGALAPEYEKTPVVFIGTVLSLKGDHHEVKVETAFKGVAAGDMIKIFYDSNRMCDLDLAPKEKYLLFLKPELSATSSTQGLWRAELCTASGTVKNSHKRIAEVKKLARKGK